MTEQLRISTGENEELIDLAVVRRKMRQWLDEYPRYVVFAPHDWALAESVVDDEHLWGPYPDVGVSFYKTARGALKAAGRFGVLCQLDFELLPIVDASESLVTKGESRNEIGDVEFCERQAILWMQRADRLRSEGK